MATRSAFSIRYSNPDANTSAKVELRLIRHRSSRAKSQVSKSGSCNRYSGTPASLQVVPPHPAFPSHIPQLSIHLDFNYLKDLKIVYPVSLLLKMRGWYLPNPARNTFVFVGPLVATDAAVILCSILFPRADRCRSPNHPRLRIEVTDGSG